MKWRVFLLEVWMKRESRKDGTLSGVGRVLRWRAKGVGGEGSLGAVGTDGRKRF